MRINFTGIALLTFAVSVGACLYPLLSTTLAGTHSYTSSHLLQQDESKRPADISTDTTSCFACHGKGDVSEYNSKYKSNEYLQLNVADAWREQDLHSNSLEMLKQSELAKSMYLILGYADESIKAQNCYTCHTSDKSPERKPTATVESRFDTNSKGIACSICHGLDARWQSKHYTQLGNMDTKEVAWRLKANSANLAQGMTDLRNPQTKAAKCASCHIGNAAEGKIVTHEMYAAGHPPLPPFEMVTFMDSQPRHWKHPSDSAYLKMLASKEPDKTWKEFHSRAADQELHQAREFAVGVIVAYQTSMKLMADQSQNLAPNGLMDFAQFDCYACHHDLRVPSDRQKRGYTGAPGRPPLKAGLAVLPRIILEHAAQMPGGEKLKALVTEFQSRHKALEQAIQSQPFGHPANVSKAANSMDEWSKSFLLELEQVRYSPNETRKLLDLIITKGKVRELVTDPEAAWQIAWASQVLSKELSRGSKGLLDTHLDELKKHVPITIRPGPDFSNKKPLSGSDDNQIAKRQKLLNDFQVNSFLKLYEDIHKNLPAQKK